MKYSRDRYVLTLNTIWMFFLCRMSAREPVRFLSFLKPNKVSNPIFGRFKCRLLRFMHENRYYGTTYTERLKKSALDLMKKYIFIFLKWNANHDVKFLVFKEKGPSLLARYSVICFVFGMRPFPTPITSRTGFYT